MKCFSQALIGLVLTVLGDVSSAAGPALPPTVGSKKNLPSLQTTTVASTVDGSQQPVRYWEPAANAGESPRPLLVFLHSWSGDYRQANTQWQKQAVERNWFYLHPNFRGRNDHPEACGSRLARQDILDAVAWAIRKGSVDTSRVYLAGSSGGGHMAMLMAARHPHRFSAVSAWVGISDLEAWYHFHVRDGKPGQYAKMIAKSLGGPPGKSAKVAAAYRDRSPLFHLQNVGDLPIDLAAGVNDGHTGSVPIAHTLLAFNVIARSRQSAEIAAEEIQELSTQKRLSQPQVGDTVSDKSFRREILLRRQAGSARVTIFQGGHEGLPQPACDWLSRQRRKTHSFPALKQHRKAEQPQNPPTPEP